MVGSGQKENDIGDNYTARRDNFQKERYREKKPRDLQTTASLLS